MKIEKIVIILITLFICLIIPNMINASGENTASSVINEVTVNWKYDLKDSNQIVNLKCTNPEDVIGSITIPEKIDGKTVVSIGMNAFENNNKITEVILPNSILEIGSAAFSKCTSLEKVNLGNVQKIGNNAFYGCTVLKNITIPKSLKSTYGLYPIFEGCTNLTTITLEEGLTIIPSQLLAKTNIKEISIPNSVEKIEDSAFSECTSLEKVNLGNVQKIGNNAFYGCTVLKNITIPKSLKSTYGLYPIFEGCTNLTTITLEEGLTIIPSQLLAKTNIKEISIPNSVEKIENDAFSDCKNLIKITILDNVTNIHENAFQNHNDDLTIYCYEKSVAAKYAIDHKIKYVYLNKDNNAEDKNNNKDNNDINNSTNKTDEKSEDKTIAKGTIPQTGVGIGLICFISIISIVGIIIYIKYKNIKDIK